MKKYIKELEDGKLEYKTINFKNLEAELETSEQKKSKEIERIQDTINSCLEENDGVINCDLSYIVRDEGDVMSKGI